MDNRLYKSVPWPAGVIFTGFYQISYVSESHFDCDSANLEYAISHIDLGSPLSGEEDILWVRVMRDDGTELLFKDGYTFSEGSSNFTITNIKGLKSEGGSAVMRLIHGLYTASDPSEYYRLCGQIPQPSYKTAGGITGLNPDKRVENGVQVYLNPASDFVKISYTLPGGLTHADLRIFDLNGKMVKQVKIGDYFDHINLDTSALNQGTYLVNILLDNGSVINEKFIKIGSDVSHWLHQSNY